MILDGKTFILPSNFTFLVILDGRSCFLASIFAIFAEMDARDAVFAGSPWRSGEKLGELPS